MSREKFKKIFLDRIDAIERESHTLAMTMTDITRHMDISRATPDRWRNRPPKTIQLIDEMEALLEDVRAGRKPPKGPKVKPKSTKTKKAPTKRAVRR